MQLADLQCIQVIHLLSVCVFLANWTHKYFALLYVMLYHWTTMIVYNREINSESVLHYLTKTYGFIIITERRKNNSS